jgi:hypothetical protein
VLLWEIPGKGPDSHLYTLNYKEIGRGDAALKQCLDQLEQSKAPHLVVLHGAFGAAPLADKQLVDRFDKLRTTRGATCLYDLRDARPVVVTITKAESGISVRVNGEVQNVSSAELGKLPAIKKAHEAKAAIVLVVDAELASANSATGERVRNAYSFLSVNSSSNIIRIDVPSARAQ